MVRIPIDSYSFRFKPLDQSMKRSVANPISLLYVVLIAFVLFDLLIVWPMLGAVMGAVLLPVVIVGAIALTMIARKRFGESDVQPPEADE
jgi:L-lactate permease